MKPIADLILEPNLGDITYYRQTARAIILNGYEILMTYSSKYDDYMTPGGGVEADEDFIEALKRELLEEVGVIAHTINPIGYIEEIRKSDTFGVMYQKSHYYLVSVDHYEQTNHETYEIEFGMTSKWVNIKDVIAHNEKVLEKRIGVKFAKIHPFSTIQRENEALKYVLKEYIEHEKI